MSDRGRVHVADAVMAAVVLVAFLGLEPVYTALVSDIVAASGPLTALLMRLVVPFVLIGVVVSVGVSARRRV